MVKRGKKPGYTLLELLVAIAIFSGVMILAIGSFARSATSSAKANVVRAKAEAARTVMDQISNDFRYVTADAAPFGCQSDQIGFCVNPSGLANVPNSVSLLLKYPDQTTYVMKTYYVSATNYTVRLIEDRDCTLSNLSACRPIFANGRTFLNTSYLLDNFNDVFEGTPSTTTATGYLKVKLAIKPANVSESCTQAEAGTCYQLSTTLVPGGF